MSHCLLQGGLLESRQLSAMRQTSGYTIRSTWDGCILPRSQVTKFLRNLYLARHASRDGVDKRICFVSVRVLFVGVVGG